jgi:putative DNA primase/helicase
LDDETGGRRFWPVTCDQIKIAELKEARDQLWAEAVARYEKGEEWWLGSDLDDAAKEAQDQRLHEDVWLGPIKNYLVNLHINQRHVTTSEMLEGPLNKPMGQWVKSDQMRVAAILRVLGWAPDGSRNRPRVFVLKDLKLWNEKTIVV